MKKEVFISDIKIGEQNFIITNDLYIRKMPNRYNLYIIEMNYNKPLFFISPYFAGVLLSKEISYPDGLIKFQPFKKLLLERKIVWKNYYYDMAYKNSKELYHSIKEKISKNENVVKDDDFFGLETDLVDKIIRDKNYY